jgi:hypothetical protein
LINSNWSHSRTGGQILSGLKRPAAGELVADSGTGKRDDDDSAAMRFAALLVSATVLARRSLGWVAGRAVDRSISPGSLSGISVLLAVCSAAWFSGGTDKDGTRGLLAMTGWLLALGASRGLPAFMARQRGRPARTDSASAGAADGGTDWLVLPEVTASDAAPARAEDGGTAAAGSGPLGFGWLASVCAAAAECAIYGGMAAGIAHATVVGAWTLAIVTVSAVAIVDLLGSCRAAAMSADRARELARSPIPRAIGSVTRVPPALRGALALAVFALGGPQAALVAVLGIEAIAILATLATLALVIPSARSGLASAAPAGPASLPAPNAPSAAQRAAAGGRREATTITAIVEVAGSGGETAAVRFTTTPSAAWLAAGRPRPSREAATGILSGAGIGTAVSRAARSAARSAARNAARGAGSRAPRGAAGSSAPRGAAGQPDVADYEPAQAGQAGSATAETRAAPATGSELILALRDDGAVARWAGRIVQGNLIPLPPALAGVIATVMLAALGLRHLPGFIAMTPPVVMMLAAPGSSHPHDSRFDWLVPALLAAAQYVYLGSLGLALALPGPIVFSACAVLVIWYASTTAMATGGAAATGGAQAATVPAALLVSEPGRDEDSDQEDRPGRWLGWGTGLGWETRMFVVGLAATFGLATFGYVGLAAYLGVLICRMVVTGYLVPREEDRP